MCFYALNFCLRALIYVVYKCFVYRTAPARNISKKNCVCESITIRLNLMFFYFHFSSVNIKQPYTRIDRAELNVFTLCLFILHEAHGIKCLS